jgi:hypothetical protein
MMQSTLHHANHWQASPSPTFRRGPSARTVSKKPTPAAASQQFPDWITASFARHDGLRRLCQT